METAQRICFLFSRGPPRTLYKAHMRAEKTRINRDLNRDLNEMLNQQFGVLGCTELPVGILMWNHYAQHHEGFVIGFDLTSRFSRNVCAP